MTCHICNRPDCDVEAARMAYHGLSGDPTSSDWPAIESRWNDALRDCHRNRVNWRTRCLAAEARIKGCAAALAEIERAHPDSLDDYSKGFRHGCQDMIAILYGEP